MKYAILDEAGRIKEIVIGPIPSGLYNPSIIWHMVPDNAAPNDLFIGGVLTPYVPPPAPEPRPSSTAVYVDTLQIMLALTDAQYDLVMANLSARQREIFARAKQIDVANAEFDNLLKLVVGHNPFLPGAP